MKVIIISCFETFDERVDLIERFFLNKKCEVHVIRSDFMHVDKKTNRIYDSSSTYIKTKPYYKNLSIKRLSSHYNFSKNAYKILEKVKPDLLYSFIPPNSLAKFSSLYKQKNPQVKLVFDIMDLWPETMPTEKFKNNIPFRYWSSIRNKNLKFANLIITECNLYRNVLKKHIGKVETKTLFLAKSQLNVVRNINIIDTEINLCYLGSINNIIDISTIEKIIRSIKKIKPVNLHVIGAGERKEELLEKSRMAGAKIYDHGKIYEPQEKQLIFDNCHFALNIMKKSVCVGLTMKSIDYIQHGIPMINNIPSDTKEMVEKNEIGINVISESKDFDQFFNEEKLSKKNIEIMQRNSLIVFDKVFSEIAFFKECEKAFSSVLV